MSIILEALKKASVDRNVPAGAVTAVAGPREDNSGALRTGIPERNSLSLSRTMLIATAVIVTAGIVALLMKNTGREVRAPSVEGYTPPPAPTAVAPKQEATTISSFIAKLSNPHLTLSGIIYGIGKPAAIIENKILEEGANIKGARIIKINSDSVEMLDQVTGQTFVLKVN